MGVQVFVALYTEFLKTLQQLVAPDQHAVVALHVADEHCVKLLALFFASFFKPHVKLLETPALGEALNVGLAYLVCISEVGAGGAR